MAQNPTPNQVYAYNGAQSTGKGVIYDALGNAIVIGANMPVGAGAGNVVTSDASGNLTLAAPAAASLPLTTLGDTLYEDATPTPVRLAGNTSATKNFLTQTGTGAISAAPAWGTIAAADLPTGTTATKGALQLDGTTGDIAASPGTAAAGAIGKPADAAHVHPQPPMFAPTGLTGVTANTSRWVGPGTTAGPPASGTFSTGDFYQDGNGLWWYCTSGGTSGSWTLANAQTLRDTYLRSSTISGESIPRSSMINNSLLLTGGTLQMTAVALPAGIPVGHLQFVSTTGAGTPSHWWFALFDSSRHMLAITADQTTGAWGNNVFQPLPIATIASGASATFTTTYTGLYYVGIVMTVSAGAVVSVLGANQATSALVGQAPILEGTSDGGLTTPPAFPYQPGAISATSTIAYAAVAT